jgi:Holliday junction DNA helicase RuvA
MFEYLHGTVEQKSPGRLVLDVGGVGYGLDIPMSTFERLPAVGGDAKVLVHYLVREDAQKLYGFTSETERDAFRQIIDISKIGPKVALSILSNLSVKDLVYSVGAGDSSRLKAVPGVGAKTAQRLVVELKGKLGSAVDDVGGPAAQAQEGGQPEPVVDRQAFGALGSLGYSEAQVAKALARARETMESDAPVEEWIRRALQVI